MIASRKNERKRLVPTKGEATSNEKEFAAECFALITEVGRKEALYIYGKAFYDCILFLKQLGVLA